MEVVRIAVGVADNKSPFRPCAGTLKGDILHATGFIDDEQCVWRVVAGEPLPLLADHAPEITHGANLTVYNLADVPMVNDQGATLLSGERNGRCLNESTYLREQDSQMVIFY